MIDYINQIRQGNIDKKDEISMQIVTGFVEENNVTLGKKEFSYIKMTTTGFNLLLDKAPTVTAQTNTGNVAMPGERPKYSINPSELSKTAFTENNVKYVKYQFHELQTKQNPPPYADTKEPTGTVRIEIAVKEEESEEFEEYLYASDEILINNVIWISQFNSILQTYTPTDGSTCNFCTPPPCANTCCYKACKYILEQIGVYINGQRIYIADLINLNDLLDGITINSNLEKGIKIIENNIKPISQGGKPVIVGVYYKPDDSKIPINRYNGKNTATMHFVVIVGKGFDIAKHMEYFRFFDPGRSEEVNGTHIMNRLYIDKENRKISGYSNNKTIEYIVTEIRINK